MFGKHAIRDHTIALFCHIYCIVFSFSYQKNYGLNALRFQMKAHITHEVYAHWNHCCEQWVQWAHNDDRKRREDQRWEARLGPRLWSQFGFHSTHYINICFDTKAFIEIIAFDSFFYSQSLPQISDLSTQTIRGQRVLSIRPKILYKL